MLNYGNYHGKCMIINTNYYRYNRQLYDYGVFIRPPKYKYLCHGIFGEIYCLVLFLCIISQVRDSDE